MGTAGVSVNLEIRYGYQGGAHAWHEGWWADPRRQRVTCKGLADLIKPAKPMQSEPVSRAGASDRALGRKGPKMRSRWGSQGQEPGHREGV